MVFSPIVMQKMFLDAVGLEIRRGVSNVNMDIIERERKKRKEKKRLTFDYTDPEVRLSNIQLHHVVYRFLKIHPIHTYQMIASRTNTWRLPIVFGCTTPADIHQKGHEKGPTGILRLDRLDVHDWQRAR